MNILLLGKHGQLGWELLRTLACLGSVTAYDYPEVDFGQPEMLRPLIQSADPNIIINAIAYTNVDKAESEPQLARLVNATSVGTIAEEALRKKALLIHYSTDYVFDGRKGTPYVEEDVPNPLNMYGQSKLEGERAIQQVGGHYLILRTSWVYSMRQGGFVTKVLQWARQQSSLKIVADQIGNPTWARMLAEVSALLIAHTVQTHHTGQYQDVYHLAGDGYASRFEWAKEIIECDPKASEHTVKEILPALTNNFPTPAERPLFSALDCDRFQGEFGISLPFWKNALALCINAS